MSNKKLITTTTSQALNITREPHQVAVDICSIRKLLGLLLVFVGILWVFSVEVRAQMATTCTAPGDEPCLYISDQDYAIDYIDFDMPVPSRENYSIPLRVRFPVNASGELPVVIWHHGGLPSFDGRTQSQRWGEILAAAGYVVIHPSRIPVPNFFEFLREHCEENGFGSPQECNRWIATSLVGPKNTRFIIDNLLMIENEINVILDENKIVVAGHSAGTNVVLANAGAVQQWIPGGKKYRIRDDRPIAFLATAPPGPIYAGWPFPGFQGGKSFNNIDRPFAFITGVSDKTPDKPPEARIIAWLTSMPGNKYLSYDTSSKAKHETMNINKCDGTLRTKHCRWIASFGLAFLDAIVRERPEAIEWLESDAYYELTDGEIELHRR